MHQKRSDGIQIFSFDFSFQFPLRSKPRDLNIAANNNLSEFCLTNVIVEDGVELVPSFAQQSL
jgi:hypothetical protein